MFDDKKGAERVVLHAARDYSGTVGRNASTAIGADETHAVTGKRTTTIGKGDKTTVETQDADLTVSIGSRTVGVAETYTLSARTIRISAAAEILIQVGGSSIKLDAAGVTILAPLVKIN
jgi:type VI secretion system secreted protein VgrG